MKSIILNLFLLFLSTLCLAQSRTFQEVTVTGNRVNIRTEPNLNCKVVYQRDWGHTFQGARYNDEWIELIDDNNNIYYGYHKYIKFVEPEIQQQTLTSTTSSSTYSLPAKSNSNTSDLVVQQSSPHILYQSEVYTLDEKPSNLPQPTVTSPTTTISSSSTVSTNQSSPKIGISQATTKIEKPFQKAEKIVQSKPVSKPSVTESIAKTEPSVKVIETKPVVEAKKEVKKVEKVVVAKPTPKPVAEVKKEVKKAEPVVEVKKEVEKVVVAKPTPKPAPEVNKEIKKATPVAQAKTVATPVTEVPESSIEDSKMIEAAMNNSPEVLEVIILLEQLEAYVELKNMQEAREIALDLINNHVDESLESNEGICILVGEEAYYNYMDILPDNGARVPELRRLLNDVYDPLVTNLIRLDLVDHWIQKEEYQYALDIMDNTMAHNSESLTFPKHCENDPNLKASPQIELKNKYFLVYHLMDDDKKKEILANLEKLTKAKNPVTQNIAKDVYKKISGDFWEKN